MKLFLILLSTISGLLLFNEETYLIGITLLIFITFILIKKFKKDKKFIFLIIAVLSITVLISFINLKTFQNNGQYCGIVIDKKENYVILFDGIEKIYFKITDQKIDLFDVISVKGNISSFTFKKPLESGFDFQKYLNNLGIDREIISTNYTTLFNFCLNIVDIKTKIIMGFSNIKCKELISCFLLNNKDYSSELILHLKNLGLINLLSLSGIYISGLQYLLFKILKNKINEAVAYLVSFFILFPLILLNITKVSIVRIFITQVITMISLFKGMKINNLSLRSFSFLLILVVDKHMIFNMSIVISLVIGYMMYFTKLIMYRKNKFFKKILSSIIFIVLMIPFNIYLNNSFNFINLFVSIMIFPTLKLFSFILYIFIFLPKIELIENLLSLYYDLLISLDFQIFNVNMKPFLQWEYIIYYFIVFIVLYFFEINYKKIWKRVSVFLIVGIIIRSLPINALFYYEIFFINVGQGDSTLLKVNGENILIDTGGSLYNDLAVNTLIPFFRKNKVYQIDRVYITHYDNDHYFALDSLKKNFRVKKIYDYNNFDSSLSNEFKIYNLNKNISNYVDENSRSLILYFVLGDLSFLLMGDSPKEVELDLISNYPCLTADILKVGHHGSNTSTHEKFIQHINPKEAIISCGENNIYHHPNDEVLKILEKNNVNIRRTDIEGTISYQIFKKIV